jgi:hypothetical protein
MPNISFQRAGFFLRDRCGAVRDLLDFSFAGSRGRGFAGGFAEMRKREEFFGEIKRGTEVPLSTTTNKPDQACALRRRAMKKRTKPPSAMRA